MAPWFFVSDLHGRADRYQGLWRAMVAQKPTAVFLGGDLLPHAFDDSWSPGKTNQDFITDFLAAGFLEVRSTLGPDYPRVFLILGNDDPQVHEATLKEFQLQGLWEYVHGRVVQHAGFTILGYSCIPPSPFLLKDFERYDVSRFVDPGCLAPEEGRHSVEVDLRQIRHTTIADELEELASGLDDLTKTILMTHCPPHDTPLDRAALDGKFVDHVPLDVHIGSIAIRRFIEKKQPLLTLHGHVHESRTLTGKWQCRLGRTLCFNAASDTPDLALIKWGPHRPQDASLELIPPKSI